MSDKRKVVLTRPSDREMVFTRLFDAPREKVWNAWSNSKQLADWWGPDGFTVTTHEMRFEPNGLWRFTMHGPDGRDYRNKITYLEIKKPERLVYKHGGEDGDEPVRFRTTATFKALADNVTELTMHIEFDTAAELQFVIENYGADKGGVQTISRLATYLGESVL